MNGIESQYGAELVVEHQPTPGPQSITPVESSEQVRSMQVTQNGTATRSGRPLFIIRAGDGNPAHGTTSTYVNHFCRCDLCRAGWATYNRELRRRRREAFGG